MINRLTESNKIDLVDKVNSMFKNIKYIINHHLWVNV